MKKDLPEKIRAFGIEMTQTNGEGRPSYVGSKDGHHLRLWQNGLDMWIARMTIRAITVEPDLTSSSYPAALRNLRGHLQNLHIEIGKLFKTQPTLKKAKAK